MAVRSAGAARIANRSFVKSLSLNGTSDYMTSPWTPTGGTTGFSIAFWIFIFGYPSGTYTRIFDYGDSTADNVANGMRCLLNSGINGIEFDCGSSGYNGYQSPNTPTGQWIHIAITYSATAHLNSLYLNSVLNGYTYAVYAAPTSQTFTIGRRSATSSDFAQILLDEFVAKDNYVFSQSDIDSLYTSGVTPTSPDIYYKFANNANDSSGNARNGTLSGTTYSTNLVSVARTVAGTRTTALGLRTHI